MSAHEKPNKQAARMVRCPQCGQPAPYSSENESRPFCSERCKLIDLGEWADGKYTIPVQDMSDVEVEEDESDDAGMMPRH